MFAKYVACLYVAVVIVVGGCSSLKICVFLFIVGLNVFFFVDVGYLNTGCWKNCVFNVVKVILLFFAFVGINKFVKLYAVAKNVSSG